jgi:hypothetical protein
MRWAIAGFAAVGAVLGFRRLARHMDKMREHCGQMAAQCKQMAEQFGGLGEPISKA